MFDFLKKTKYPPQQLSDLQYELTCYIDAKCIETLDSPKDYQSILVHTVVVPLSQQFLPRHVINKSILQHLPKSGGYLPRSVAFVQSGTDWYFMIGIYESNVDIDQTKQVLFIDALTRTNTARNEKENA